MEIIPAETEGGSRWFLGAGLVAVLFSLFLYVTDEKLSNSKRDENLGKALHELRLAQTSLGVAEMEDPRTKLSRSGAARPNKR